MKRNLLIIVVVMLAANVAEGQVPDTVYLRGENYYYMEWYDEMYEFYHYDSLMGPTCLLNMGNYMNVGSYTGRDYTTSKPLQVKGLACMVLSDKQYFCSRNGDTSDSLERLPEYLYLFLRDSSKLELVDSVRWDTAAPKVFKLPRNIDTSYGFMYCELYEGMFDEPRVVDGDFFIAGTYRSNECTTLSYPYHYPRKIVCYVGVWGQLRLRNSWTRNAPSLDTPWPWLGGYCAHHGPFNAILTGNRLIQLHSDDYRMGTAEGEGFFPDLSTQYIRAVPSEHYRFAGWNDGDTTNPRAVLLTQDTSFTAYFRASEEYELSLESNDAEHGNVYGAGRYEAGDTAKVWATARDPYRFAYWNDGDTANPRWVVMTQDTSFVGIFVSMEGIEAASGGQGLRLVPNPADRYVVASCDQSADGLLAITDVTGREVRRYRMRGTSLRIDTQELAGGIYYVTLTTPHGISTQRLVVE